MPLKSRMGRAGVLPGSPALDCLERHHRVSASGREAFVVPGENGSADRSTGSGPTPPSAPAPRPASAWAPLRFFPVFRALWIAQFASNVGTWMQTVGAQWLLIDHSPLLVSLVQTASSLPIVLLALPAGAFADLVDRRRLLLGAQLAMFLAASALAVTTFVGAASPALSWVSPLPWVVVTRWPARRGRRYSPTWSIVSCSHRRRR